MRVCPLLHTWSLTLDFRSPICKLAPSSLLCSELSLMCTQSQLPPHSEHNVARASTVITRLRFLLLHPIGWLVINEPIINVPSSLRRDASPCLNPLYFQSRPDISLGVLWSFMSRRFPLVYSNIPPIVLYSFTWNRHLHLAASSLISLDLQLVEVAYNTHGLAILVVFRHFTSILLACWPYLTRFLFPRFVLPLVHYLLFTEELVMKGGFVYCVPGYCGNSYYFCLMN